MRRKERQVIEIAKIIEIIQKSNVLRIIFMDDRKPYIIPFNFGFHVEGEQLVFYMHSAKEGKKIDLLKKDQQVYFELDYILEVKKKEMACHWACTYASVIGEGVMEIIEKEDEKIFGLDCLMKQYGFVGKPQYSPFFEEKMVVLKLCVQQLNAKSNQ